MEYHFLLLIVFIIGYILLISEHWIKINKSATALLTGMFLWALYLEIAPAPMADKLTSLYHHLGEISQILLFLIGAMTIVELIASHRGFEVINQSIATGSPRKFFWMVGWIAFWVSSVLDNLTTILVMSSLIGQTVNDKKMSRLFAAGLVFSVNAGGAWTPIGDVTTTMLWIGGEVTTLPIMTGTGLASILSNLVFCLLFMTTFPQGKLKLFPQRKVALPPGAKGILWLGILGLLAVPIMKLALDIPPFMGMMISLGLIWVITDRWHYEHEDRKNLRVSSVLTKIDVSCILFFLGILLAVTCLEAAGILAWLADLSNSHLSNPYHFSMVIGILSSIIDNVPLVAAVMHMFDASTFPPDHVFWFLIAYCAGVGGSLLIIGSAPGVAIMSLRDIRFFWYVKHVSWAVLIAYVCGWGLIYLTNVLFS